jgi:undecaprenyl diphosphate synthase
MLMRLFRAHLRSETPRLLENGVRLSIIGRRDRLPLVLRDAIEKSERDTAHGSRLHLRLAIDYSARDAIARAACRLRDNGIDVDDEVSREQFSALLGATYAPGAFAPDVDLLIRSGGERRLSDFLLWECAYAELHFTDVMWPDFSAADLAAAVGDFQSRERRFGALPERAAG